MLQRKFVRLSKKTSGLTVTAFQYLNSLRVNVARAQFVKKHVMSADWQLALFPFCLIFALGFEIL